MTERFGVIDELSCYHDHPDEPNNVHLELAVPGHLDETALRGAVRTVLAAESAARCRRARHRPLATGYYWEFPPDLDADPLSVATWQSGAQLDLIRAAFLDRAPPLVTAPPVRLLLARGPDEDRLLLNAHHAALDGGSCLQLLRAIGRSYPGCTAGDRPGPAIAPAPAQAAAPPASANRRRRGVVTRIAADNHGAGRQPGYGYHLLPALDPASLRPAAAAFAATINDLLLAALALAITQWNAAHGRRSSLIRLTMPIDSRAQGRRAGLGNLSRLAAVTIGPQDRASIRRLVSGVTTQTTQAKRAGERQTGRLPQPLASPLLPVALKRGLLRGLLRTIGPFVIDTSLLTNLGEVTDPVAFGTLAATSMAFSTSAHMPRGLSVGVVTVASQLQICLRYRRALLDEASAAAFADGYAAALAEITRAR